MLPPSEASAAGDTDWSSVDRFHESTCTCRCGAVFRAHAKCVRAPAPRLIARKRCPSCGRDDDICRISSGPELMTIGG